MYLGRGEGAGTMCTSIKATPLPPHINKLIFLGNSKTIYYETTSNTLKFQYRLSIPQFSGSHGSTLILPYTPLQLIYQLWSTIQITTCYLYHSVSLNVSKNVNEVVTQNFLDLWWSYLGKYILELSFYNKLLILKILLSLQPDGLNF